MAAVLISSLCSARPVAAGPALLFDAGNGQVLYADDADQAWYPASLTKMMTAYLTFEALKAGKLAWDTKLVTSEKAHAQPPSKVGLPVGGQLALDQSVRALIIKSANDVAVMLAEAVSGTEEAFIEQMNATAKRLGMSRSRFVNPNGLPEPQQVTTARDMGLLGRALLRDFPEYASLWSEERMSIGRIRLGTHNSLLRTFAGADGIKTGFICASGYNVVASASRDGRRLIAVVLGETTGHARQQRAAALLEHGFEHYNWKASFEPKRIDDMPFSPAEATEAMDLRKMVRAFECGTRVAGPKSQKQKVAAKGSRKKAEQGSQTAGAALAPPAPEPVARTGSIAPARQEQ
jgi:D-alanyl-D-alanine carboxypeptidase